MRTTTLLALGAAILVAACSDDQSPSPTSPRTANGSLRSASAVSASSGPISNAKPVDHVGFTKITRVLGTPDDVDVNHSGTSRATCPDGTTIVGGGFGVTHAVPGSTPPWFLSSADDDNNGWIVTVANNQPGAALMGFQAVADCAS